MVVISVLLAFSSSVVSLLGLVSKSLVDVSLGVGDGVDSVGEGSNLGVEVGDLGVVLVQVLGKEADVGGEGNNSLVFSLSLEVERLVELVLEIVDELDDSADELLVSLLLGSGGEGGEELDGLSVSLDVVHLVDLDGVLAEVGSDLSQDLGSDVDGLVGVGLEEAGLLEVVGEESSGLGKDSRDEFEFLSLLLELGVLVVSLVGGSIDDSLELGSGGVLGVSLADLLLSDGVKAIKLVLELR